MNRSLDLLRFGGDTDTGLVREHNEDRLLLLPDIGVFGVIDGMGGESAGEKAAEIAVAVLKANFLKARREAAGAELIRNVQLAILDANNQIFEMAAANEEWSGMACVLTVAVVREDRVTVGHVGDSRLYKLNRDRIEKLTKDHSPVGVREDARELTEIQAMRDSRRNEVFRDVGSQLHREDDYNFADVFETTLEPDSALLLCSDGLTDMVTSAEIQRIAILNAGDPVQASRELIRIANEAGGRDNVTAIVVEGPLFKEAAFETTAPAGVARQAGRSIASAFRPLISRPAMFLYGAVAGIGLLFYLQTGVLRLQPQTIRVSPVAGSFLTISEGLLAAKEGDRVEVEPGEYAESIVLPNGVTLLSTIPQGAIIRPPKTASGIATGIVGEGVQAHISGFKIAAGEGGLDVGIRLKDTRVLVTNVEISGASVAGLQIEGNTSGLIRGNSIDSGAGPAVVVRGANEVRVEMNFFVRKSGSQPALEVADGASVQFVRNVIEGYGHTPIRGPAPVLAEIMKNHQLFVDAHRSNQPMNAAPSQEE